MAHINKSISNDDDIIYTIVCDAGEYKKILESVSWTHIDLQKKEEKVVAVVGEVKFARLLVNYGRLKAALEENL